MNKKELIDVVTKQISNKLKLEGFEKKKGIHVKDIGNNVLGNIGLNMITERFDNKIEINPVIGVIHKDVEVLYKKLSNFNTKYYIFTGSIPLGYLTPKKTYQTWSFYCNNNLQNNINLYLLINKIKKYAPPFWDKMRDKEQLLEFLLSPDSPTIQTAYVHELCPIILYLLNRNEEAVEMMNNWLKDKFSNDESYQDFVRNLKSMINI